MSLYGQTFNNQDEQGGQNYRQSNNLYGQTFNPSFKSTEPLSMPMDSSIADFRKLENTPPAPVTAWDQLKALDFKGLAGGNIPQAEANPIVGENLFLQNAFPIRQNDNPLLMGLKGIGNFGASTLAAPGEMLRKLSLEGGSLLSGNGLQELP